MKHKCFQIGFLWFIHIRFYVSIYTHISGASVGWTVLTNNSCTISFNVIRCANDMFIVTIIHRSPTHAPPREGERSLCRPPPQSLTYDRHSCNSCTIICSWIPEKMACTITFFFISNSILITLFICSFWPIYLFDGARYSPSVQFVPTTNHKMRPSSPSGTYTFGFYLEHHLVFHHFCTCTTFDGWWCVASNNHHLHASWTGKKCYRTQCLVAIPYCNVFFLQCNKKKNEKATQNHLLEAIKEMCYTWTNDEIAAERSEENFGHIVEEIRCDTIRRCSQWPCMHAYSIYGGTWNRRKWFSH